MHEFELKSDDSCALCIFQGETAGKRVAIELLIWGNKAVFEPFVDRDSFLV